MKRPLPLLLALLVATAGCMSEGGVKMEKTLEVGSVFHDGEFIPKEYTCEGDDTNPPIYIGNIPAEAKSLVIIVDDPPDAPAGTFTHWIAWNIPPVGRYLHGCLRNPKPTSRSTSSRERTTSGE